MKPLIVANWKMNPVTMKEAEELFNSVFECVKNIKNTETVICPPFIYLPLLKGLTLGAQDCYWEEKGAYTGEVSVAMLKEMGCKYVIIGHSERRKIFNETNQNVNKKLKSVLEEGLIPIMCIGETEQEREQEKTEEVLKQELTEGFEGISNVSNLVIAYEPIWAIGTGNPCDIEEAKEMNLLIKRIISKLYNLAVSKKIRILYGGSVKANNAEGYLKQVEFDGLLVGGASLSAQEFVDLIKKIC